MDYQTTLARLYPPVAYNVRGEQFLAQCEVDAKQFERLEESALSVLNGMEPETARVMLSDWERICGITPDLTKPYAARVNRVIVQLNAVGGLSIPYFKRLAESIGYQIQIKEFSPQQNDLPNAGDVPFQNSEQDTLGFMWKVTVTNANDNIRRFRAGISSAGERLTDFGDPIIEEFFRDLKPAHTYCYFAYQG